MENSGSLSSGDFDSEIDPEAYNAAEDIDQLLAEDSQVAGEDDPLDAGYSPPERPLGLRDEDTLDERLAQELPDDDPDGGDGLGDNGEELMDGEVGRDRSGRLVASDEGGLFDDQSDLIASDVGIDGGAASAEEAAMHIVSDEYEYEDEIGFESEADR